MKVLIGEDNLINTRVARKMVERLGHSTATTFDGKEVLDALQSSADFDILLLDLHMPQLDGFGVLEALPKLFPNGEGRPRVVVLTADALVETRNRCQSLGVDAFLTKPLRLNQLELAIAGEPIGLVSETASNLIDTSHVDAMIQALDREDFHSIFLQFKNEIPIQLPDLRRLFLKEEHKAFANLVHAIRGTSNTFGFTRLNHILKPLEQSIADGNPHYPENWYEESCQCMELSIAAIDEHMRGS